MLDDEGCHPLWRLTVLMISTVLFALILWYGFMDRPPPPPPRPLSPEEMERSRAQREQARLARLARLPGGPEKKATRTSSKPKVKVQLQPPSKFLPKVDPWATKGVRLGTSTTSSISHDVGPVKTEKNTLEQEASVHSPNDNNNNDEVNIRLRIQGKDGLKAVIESTSTNATDTVDDEESTFLQQALLASLAQNKENNDTPNDKDTTDNKDNSEPNLLPAASSTIGFHHIPGLPNEEHAEFLLKRMAKEFVPIIQRRGYRVMAVSE